MSVSVCLCLCLSVYLCLCLMCMCHGTPFSFERITGQQWYSDLGIRHISSQERTKWERKPVTQEKQMTAFVVSVELELSRGIRILESSHLPLGAWQPRVHYGFSHVIIGNIKECALGMSYDEIHQNLGDMSNSVLISSKRFIYEGIETCIIL